MLAPCQFLTASLSFIGQERPFTRTSKYGSEEAKKERVQPGSLAISFPKVIECSQRNALMAMAADSRRGAFCSKYTLLTFSLFWEHLFRKELQRFSLTSSPVLVKYASRWLFLGHWLSWLLLWGLQTNSSFSGC